MRRRRHIGLFGRAALVLALAGCGGGTETVPLEVELIQIGQQVVSERRGQNQGGGAPLTRALLDTIDGPVLEVTLERSGQLAYMDPLRGGSDRGISVWRSLDQATITLRNGVLIATRGLGGGVLSSRVPVSGTQPGPSHSGEQVQVIRVLDKQKVRLTLACDLVDLGPATIEIVERRHATRHLQQHCTGGGGQVTNDYWVDSAAGLVRQSRQWAGPHVGYLRIRRLID